MDMARVRAREADKPGRGLYGIKHGWWAIICLVYVLSPLDLAPELILGPIGVIDDAGVALFGFYNAAKWVAQWRRARRGRSRPWTRPAGSLPRPAWAGPSGRPPAGRC